MNPLKSLSSIVLVAVLITGCSKQDTTTVSETSPQSIAASSHEAPKPDELPKSLREILVGVWATVDPAQLNARGAGQVTIDFRESGEFTLMAPDNGGVVVNGKYQLEDGELTMVTDKPESGEITTKYENGLLTVTDVSNDHSVDFKPLD